MHSEIVKTLDSGEIPAPTTAELLWIELGEAPAALVEKDESSTSVRTASPNQRPHRIAEKHTVRSAMRGKAARFGYVRSGVKSLRPDRRERHPHGWRSFLWYTRIAESDTEATHRQASPVDNWWLWRRVPYWPVTLGNAT